MSPPRNILIIGAGSGIGRALALQLAAQGQRVFAVARSADKLAALAADASAARHPIETNSADATREEELNAVVDGIVDRAEGVLAGLAYCPGSIDLMPLARVTAASMQSAFSLNCVGAALAVKRAHSALKVGQGSVVLFSTVAVAQGFTNHTIVAAAKGAVEAMTRSLAAELAPHVRVNCIAPSLTRTPLAEKLTQNATVADAIAKMHALPRLGEAEDVAHAAAYLLGAESAWVTGQVLAVDGGRSTLRTKG